jgi:hypothetical protein
MIFSFPDSSPEKMWHFYAIFKDPGVAPSGPRGSLNEARFSYPPQAD